MAATSQIEELPVLILGKGVTLTPFIDHSKSKDSSERVWVELIYSGEEGADISAVGAPPHWHKNHDEIFEVFEGSINCYLDGHKKILSAGDPPLIVPRGHVHSFDAIGLPHGQRIRTTERTTPAGTYKVAFFQDLFHEGSGMPRFLVVMRVFCDGDAYPALPGGIRILENLFVTIVGTFARLFVKGKPKELKRKVD